MEDDGGSFFLGLAEEIAYAAGSHAHEHLDKIRSGQREEGHVGFAGHSLGQQRLTRSRRSYEKCALGDFTAQFGVLCRVLQEVHDFLDFLLCAFLSGYVLEQDLGALSLFKQTGLALAYREDAAGSPASACTAEHEVPKSHQQEYGHDKRKEIAEVIYFLLVGHLHGVFGDKILEGGRIADSCGGRGVFAYFFGAFLEDVAHVFGLDGQACDAATLVQHDFVTFSCSHVALEFGVAYFFLVAGASEAVGKQQDAQSENDNHIQPAEVEARLVILFLFHMFFLPVCG